MSILLAIGLFLTFVGLVALSFGLYALLRGGRGQRGGTGTLSERGIHLVAGIRMIAIGTAGLGLGLYALWVHYW